MKSSINVANGLRVLCAVLALVPTFCNPSDAQQPRQATRRQLVKPNQLYGAGTNQDQLRFQQLRQAPTDLPMLRAIAPPGSRFYYGLKSVNNKGMTNLQLHYKTALDAGSALQTYSAQFADPRSGWQMLPMPRDGKTVGARQGSNSCVVQYIAGGVKGNELIINYQFHAEQ